MSEVEACYFGSDGDRTRALYLRLLEVGEGRGDIAVNLLRTCKNSERAKCYKSGRSAAKAYATKDWAIGQLVLALKIHGDEAGFTWGWGYDAKTVNFEHVLYVDVPGAGQVSFHTGYRGEGPDYGKPWDGAKGTGAARVIRYAEAVLSLDVSFRPSNQTLTQGEQDVARQDRSEGKATPRDAGEELRGGDAREKICDQKTFGF